MGDEKKLGFIITARDLASKEFKSVNGEIAKMEKTTKGAKTGLGGLASTVSPMKLALGGIGIASIAAAEGLSIAIDAASDLRESVSLSDSVFTENSKEVQAWAATAAGAFGQSKREALDFASNFGNAFKNVGLSLDESTDKAQEMTRLAADLGSAFNAGADEAALALRSGLLGESEPLRRFGVFLSEAATQAKAVEIGIAKAGQKLTDAQKVTARYAIIMEDTAAIQGMFGKDTSSLADAQKELGAEVENLAASVGTALVPALASAVGGTADWVAETQTGIDKLGEFGEDFTLFGEDMDRWGQAIANVSSVMPWNVPSNFGKFIDSLNGVETATAGIAGAWGHASDAFTGSARKELADTIKSYAKEIPWGITEAGAAAMREAREIPASIASGIRERRQEPVDAMIELQDLMKNAMAPSEEMARLKGQLTSDALVKGLKSSDPVVRAQAEYTQDIIVDRMTELKDIAAEKARLAGQAAARAFVAGFGNPNLHFKMTTDLRGYYASEHRAAGGPVEPGHVYEVGEAGRETLVMNPGGGGYVIPNGGGSQDRRVTDRSTSRSGGGRAPVVNLTIQTMWPPSREHAREIAELVDRELAKSWGRAAPTMGRV